MLPFETVLVVSKSCWVMLLYETILKRWVHITVISVGSLFKQFLKCGMDLSRSMTVLPIKVVLPVYGSHCVCFPF